MSRFRSQVQFAGSLAKRLIKPLPDPILPFDPATGVHFYALGTSGSAPGFDNRQTSSYLLEVDGRRALIDAGTGLFMNYPRNRDPMEEIETIVISHLHPDHVGDLDQFVVANLFGARGRVRTATVPEDRLYRRKTIIGPPGTRNFLLGRLNAVHTSELMAYMQLLEDPDTDLRFTQHQVIHGPKRQEDPEVTLVKKQGHLVPPDRLDEAFDIQELGFQDPDLAYRWDSHRELKLFDGAVILQAYPVPHLDFDDHISSFGLRFQVPDKSRDESLVLAFSGDTLNHPVLERVIKDARLAVMDMAGEPVHLTAAQAAQLAAANGVEVLGGTHLMPWGEQGLPEHQRREAEQHFPGRIDMLISGTVMTLDGGKVSKPYWIETGQPVTRRERETFERGGEPRLAPQYIPRGAAVRSGGRIPSDPAAIRAAKSTRGAQLKSVLRPKL